MNKPTCLLAMFRPTQLALSLTIVLSSVAMPTFANDTPTPSDADTPVVHLEGMKITLNRRLHKKSEETTGLGKTVRTMEDIQNQQILSVRDLVKDMPGVAVVEQGRGASSGFSIRGMDKNRVAVSVDGINQIQSYLVQKRQYGDGREGSGAINEIEMENVSSLIISQGASGSESGSGALGGAVSFRTKGVDDVITQDRPFGLSHKSAYSSRDGQWLHTLSIGTKWDTSVGGFDAFLQYTDRTKHEVKPHKDIYKTNYQVWRWAGTPADFATGKITPDSDPKRQFVILDECPTYQAKDVSSVLNCVKPKLRLTPTLETMNAKDYTGDKRVLGDPMDYHSGSTLFKLGYTPSPNHRLESVFEHTKQRYNTQDMTMPAYHLTPQRGEGNLAQSYLVYRDKNYSEGIRTDAHIGLWTQARFFDEVHQKDRTGLSYRYKHPTNKGLVDNLLLSADRQTVKIDHLQLEKYCSPYPIVDKNCVAGFDKPNSAESQNRKIYDETHQLIKLDFDKTLNTKLTKHQLAGAVGFDKFRSNLWIGDIFEKYYHLDFTEEDYLRNPNGGFIDLYRTSTRFNHLDVCKDNNQHLGEARKCGDRTITGHNAYASLKNTSHLGDLASLSMGLRFDQHEFKSNDTWAGDGKYNNTSWNIGLVVKPTDYLDVAYRASSGYRVPSFKELFGYRLDGIVKGENDNSHYRTNVVPEKALNQEIGVNFKGQFGNLELSYFDNRYKDLIDLTLKSADVNGQSVLQWGYRNYQDVRLTGTSLGAKLYFNDLSERFPAGLTGKVAYLRTNVKESNIKEGFYWGSGYFLDSISPTRYVLGLDYVADSDKWGVGANWTITNPKDSRELTTIVASPDGSTYDKQATKVSSNGWNTLDLSAFYRPNNHFTIRASVNNAFNHRYSPWEALRQTSITSGNAHNQGLPSQYAGAGRNFVLSVESKF